MAEILNLKRRSGVWNWNWKILNLRMGSQDTWAGINQARSKKGNIGSNCFQWSSLLRSKSLAANRPKTTQLSFVYPLITETLHGSTSIRPVNCKSSLQVWAWTYWADIVLTIWWWVQPSPTLTSKSLAGWSIVLQVTSQRTNKYKAPALGRARWYPLALLPNRHRWRASLRRLSTSLQGPATHHRGWSASKVLEKRDKLTITLHKLQLGHKKAVIGSFTTSPSIVLSRTSLSQCQWFSIHVSVSIFQCQWFIHGSVSIFQTLSALVINWNKIHIWIYLKNTV